MMKNHYLRNGIEIYQYDIGLYKNVRIEFNIEALSGDCITLTKIIIKNLAVLHIISIFV